MRSPEPDPLLGRFDFMKTLLTALVQGLAALALCLSVPAAAMLPTAPEPAAEPAEPAQPLEDTRDAGADQRIEQRIGDIFAEIPSLSGVEVDVREGVVSLSGFAPDDAAIARAENIAGRFDVAAVENAIERDVSVDSGLGALASLSDRIAGFGEALPLIGLALLVAAAIAAIGYLIAGMSALWRRVMPNAFLAEVVASAIRFVFVVLGLVVALDMLGAGALLGAVLGGAGVVGIALGFAMRDTIENYVASLMLSLRQPFRANDHVLIGDLEGRVIRLTSRATILMTLDGNHLRIPNGQVFKAVIVNYTRNPQRRFDFELGIDADDDPRTAMTLGRDVLAGLPFVLDDPEPAARIQQVGDSNIVILFLGWVDQREADWFKSRSLAIAAVKEALEEAGFALPEPIYRLRFDGRTGPLPIGRAARVTETTPPDSAPKPAPAPTATASEDVRPESEIAEMVEEERRSEGGQAKDLLDSSRPVE